ncbi:hypothetical protein [Candidatus Laterigemmans baculatus]|uniref:hypothetical protein n=1 Tax=Candidatus Laterigemmans baculatus TaxID=2770505 RepID=UPI0013DCF497|nr:hypothetical protein [Candidatus Laterigemmans baculatus]
MNPPRSGAFHDAENQLRRDWLSFTAVWQRTAEHWKDARRRQFETEYLAELPGAMSHTAAEIVRFRETLQKALRALSDDETPA